jgi:hypothetical protein
MWGAGADPPGWYVPGPRPLEAGVKLRSASVLCLKKLLLGTRPSVTWSYRHGTWDALVCQIGPPWVKGRIGDSARDGVQGARRGGSTQPLGISTFSQKRGRKTPRKWVREWGRTPFSLGEGEAPLGGRGYLGGRGSRRAVGACRLRRRVALPWGRGLSGRARLPPSRQSVPAPRARRPPRERERSVVSRKMAPHPDGWGAGLSRRALRTPRVPRAGLRITSRPRPPPAAR